MNLEQPIFNKPFFTVFSQDCILNMVRHVELAAVCRYLAVAASWSNNIMS